VDTSQAKVPVDELTGVPETLLIPLVARAQARARYADLGFADPTAERLLDRLELDPSRFDHHIPSMRGAILRAGAFDQIARAFAASHPRGLVANLGSGLDTRAERVDGSGLTWVDLDLPPAVELRQRLLTTPGHHRLVAGSITDPAWAERIGWEPGQPLLLLVEAVLLYLPPDEVRAFLTRLADQFPTGAQVAFDYGADLMVRNTHRQPTLKTTTARFQWSARGARQIAAWHPALRVLADRNLATRALVPGLPGIATATLSRTLRLATGGWLYGLAHLAVEPTQGRRRQ
jgi:O-methyltransferase involved in polyketide biosynthesis